MANIENSKFLPLGAAAGVTGGLLTLIAGALHPKGVADVGTVSEWMTRVGSSEIWRPIHLALLLAALLLLLASRAIALSFRDASGRAWAETAWIANVMATAVAVTTFLFDGAVVKSVAQLWKAKTPPDAAIAGAATLATETGFILVAGLQLTTGLVAVLFGIAGLVTPGYSRWLSILAVAAGALAFVPGAIHYLRGPSTWTVSVVYVSGALIATWFLVTSARLWRHRSQTVS